MPQDRKSGAAANLYGRETAAKITKLLGTKLISSNSNECKLNGKRVVIKCSKKNTKCVGVSYQMLKRLDAIVAAFETERGMYDLYELSPCDFADNMRETRSKGPAAGRVGLVTKSVFEDKGRFIKQIVVPGTNKTAETHTVSPSKNVFPNKSKREQHIIALSLARLCHHAHPEIVQKIRLANEEERGKLVEILPAEVDIADYFHKGSACVFPGVRRFIGKLNKKELFKYVAQKKAIIDDNRFPRHFWTYLVAGQAYSGPIWKKTGLCEFELAHVFSHKADEKRLEERVFEHVDLSQKPYGLFTCPSNVVLISKGMAKPTDGLDAILTAFFKRHIELYGKETLPGLRDLKESEIPEWYDELQWNEPILPSNWQDNVLGLLKYRYRRLKKIFSSPISK